MPAGISPKEYSSEYIEACFYAWYRAGRPALQNHAGTVPVGGTRIVKVLPRMEDGRLPDIFTVRRWMDKYGWMERADALDAEVAKRLDEDVIKQRIKDLKKMADAGGKLLDKALKYFEETDQPFIGEPGAAVRALIAGSEMLFKYGGAADRLTQIAQMSDKQLEAEARRLLGKEPEDENEDAIDAKTEDIPSKDEQQQDDND